MAGNVENSEALSTSAREALAVNFNSAYHQFVHKGRGNSEAYGLLEGLTPANVLLRPSKSADDAACVLSGLWLWHDWLDQSHQLSQAIHTPSGSYWHAIMHRREGDFWNSKYWLNKCTGHPALAAISRRSADVINASRDGRTLQPLIQGDFDAASFVDLVEQLHAQKDDPRRAIVVAVQRIEWTVLIEHCIIAAKDGI